jgi:uncharacterized protein (DUF433 family)
MTAMGIADDLHDDLIVLPPDRAAALAGISRRQLVYWDLVGIVGPGIARRLSVRGNVQLYTFGDLICLCVLAQIRRRFSLQRMRKVVAHLRSRGYNEPLAELHFALHGRKEIYFQHPDGTWEGDLRSDQLVMHEVIELDPIRARIRRATRRTESDFGKVERHRGRRASNDVFAGTRLPVQTVVSWLQNGFTAEQVIDAYPDLTLADVQVARTYLAAA